VSAAIEIARRTMLDALPPKCPPHFRMITSARFIDKKTIVADLIMFDGMEATAHFRKWALGWSHGWDALPGGDISFEEGAWIRIGQPNALKEAGRG
jgi:hypothetical protein